MGTILIRSTYSDHSLTCHWSKKTLIFAQELFQPLTDYRATLEANLWKSHSKTFWILFLLKIHPFHKVSQVLPGFYNFWHMWPLVTFFRQINVASKKILNANLQCKQWSKWRDQNLCPTLSINSNKLLNRKETLWGHVSRVLTCRKTCLSAYIGKEGLHSTG